MLSKINGGLSQNEVKLLKSFYLDSTLFEYLTPIQLYSEAMSKCFIHNMTGPNVECLRNAMVAIHECSPYRLTLEFEKLITF